MKRLFALLLTLLLIGSVALAEPLDYANMTDEELHDIIDAVRNELTTRELNFGEKTVILDQDGAKMYLTGKYDLSNSGYLELEAVFINDTGREASISFDEVYVNGWELFAMGMGGCDNGKKKKGTIDMNLADADITTFEEIEEMEFHLHLYDGNYNTFLEPDPVVVQFY